MAKHRRKARKSRKAGKVSAAAKKQRSRFKAAVKYCRDNGRLGKKYKSCMAEQLKK